MKTRAKTEAERMAARQAAAEKRRSLLDAEKSLDAEKRAEMLAAAGAIRTTDGAGLSPKNQILVYIQASAQGFAPSLVGGFKQWRDQGRQVRKGARGLLICFPKMKKDEETEADTLAGFGWGYVFDISQTCRKGEEMETETETESETETETEAETETPAPSPAPAPVAAPVAVDPSPAPAPSAAPAAGAGASDDMAAIMAAIAAA